MKPQTAYVCKKCNYKSKSFIDSLIHAIFKWHTVVELKLFEGN